MVRSSTVDLDSPHEPLGKTIRDLVYRRLLEKGGTTIDRATFEHVMDAADGTALKYFAWRSI